MVCTDQSANEIRFTTNSTDRLTIESNGEVGIGTVNPCIYPRYQWYI